MLIYNDLFNTIESFLTVTYNLFAIPKFWLGEEVVGQFDPDPETNESCLKTRFFSRFERDAENYEMRLATGIDGDGRQRFDIYIYNDDTEETKVLFSENDLVGLNKESVDEMARYMVAEMIKNIPVEVKVR